MTRKTVPLDDKPKKENSQAERPENRADHSQASPAPVLPTEVDVLQTLINEYKTRDGESSRLQGRNFWLGVITVAVIVAYTTVAALQWCAMLRTNKLTRQSADAAKESAKVATQTLVASQRAWIRIDQIGLGGGGLAIDRNGASVSVSFTITNVGNSPAITVTPDAWLVVLKSGALPLGQEQQKRCGEIRNQPFGLGFTLFPNESFPSNIGIDEWSLGTNVSRKDIEKGATVSADKAHMLLYVVGCIDYTFPTDAAAHHQTGFILEVREDRVFSITLKDGIIPVSRLSLIDTGIGTGKYAD
jgi:hypothetical protein